MDFDNKIRTSTLDGFAVVYILWSVFFILFSAGLSAGVVTCLNVIILASTYVFARAIPNKTWVLRGLVILGVLQASVALLQYFGVINSNHSIFKITGLMGNPGQLGGFQAVSLISCLLIYRQVTNWTQKIVVIASTILILYSVMISDSRASLLAIISGSVVLIPQQWYAIFKKYTWVWIILLCVIGFFVWAIYLYRPDSVNARILIWRVSARMFLDKPIFGFGFYGFSSHYMQYQGDFLSACPNEKFTSIASDVSYPYNDIVRVLVEQGLVGFSLLIMFIYKAFKGVQNKNLCAPLITVLTFSFFSYSSYKLSLNIMFPMLLGILEAKPLVKSYLKSLFLSHYSFVSIIACILGLLFYEYNFQRHLSNFYSSNDAKILSDIEMIFKRNHNNLKMNSCYSTLVKHFPEVLTDETIPLLLPSIENCCTAGMYYFLKSDYDTAEKYFLEASRMGPNYIQPKYNLWMTYVKQGRDTDAINIADEITHMKVKVESTYTLSVRNKMLYYYSANKAY